VAWIENGRKTRRDPEVFQRVENFTENPALIAEISFTDPVHLPKDTEYGGNLCGPWRLLFDG
jgi:hypothetical protein